MALIEPAGILLEKGWLGFQINLVRKVRVPTNDSIKYRILTLANSIKGCSPEPYHPVLVPSESVSEISVAAGAVVHRHPGRIIVPGGPDEWRRKEGTSKIQVGYIRSTY